MQNVPGGTNSKYPTPLSKKTGLYELHLGPVPSEFCLSSPNRRTRQQKGKDLEVFTARLSASWAGLVSGGICRQSLPAATALSGFQCLIACSPLQEVGSSNFLLLLIPGCFPSFAGFSYTCPRLCKQRLFSLPFGFAIPSLPEP